MIQNLAYLDFLPRLPLWLILFFASLALIFLAYGLYQRARGIWWRALAVVVLLGALCNPRLLREERETRPDIAILAVDRSDSTQIADRAERIAAARAALEARAARLPALDLRVVEVPEAGQRGTALFSALGAALADVPRARLAGVIALTQWDIKKVLAYSTVSQLGFMVAACGVGAYVAAVFHLLTHAFFKALLFLGSGSVIHGIEHNPKSATHAPLAHGGEHHGIDPQDMRNMGGLKSRMKITFVTYLIGGLALAGVPPLAGFWSKDEILVSASESNPIVFWMLAITAVLTAFYTMRQIRLVFFGEPRTKEAWHTVESGPQMTIPLVILAVFSVVGGMVINWPFEAVLPPHALSHWLEPVLHKLEVVKFDFMKAGVFTALAIAAMGTAYFMYKRSFNENVKVEPLEKLGPLYALSSNKFYLDQIYRALVVIPFHGIATVFAQVIDKNGIDAVVNGIGSTVRAASSSLRDIQTGFVRSYGLVMLLGVAVLVAWFVFTR